MNVEKLIMEDYTYELPDEKIAIYPLKNRDDSKLLIYKNKIITKGLFKNISNTIPKNSLMVFNNTMVIKARLNFKKSTGAGIEIFCLEPYDPSDYSLAFQKKHSCLWQCMVGNLKKWKDEKLQLEIVVNDKTLLLNAEKTGKINNSIIVKFTWKEDFMFGEILEEVGNIPIPPYLNRKSEEIDKTRYQTVYSKFKGSVAAPTAGLHFTNSVLKSLEYKNIKIAELTLHVGAGTFKPVSEDNIENHEMHTEHFVISENLIQNLIQNRNSIVSVGTTTLRTLESIYYLGCKIVKNPDIELHNLKINQWEPYKISEEVEVKTALLSIISLLKKRNIKKINASTQIIIVPGYKFKIVDILITNFHQPKSTLLLLVAAFIGNNWKAIYDFAYKNNFRFLSYGDSSILIR